MANPLRPTVDQWYRHRGKGQWFCVIAVNPASDSIDVQHFDGDLEEFTFTEWRRLELEPCEAPENWSGPLDVNTTEDLGTEITDTDASDWHEEEEEYHKRSALDGDGGEDGERVKQRDDYGEGTMEEESNG